MTPEEFREYGSVVLEGIVCLAFLWYFFIRRDEP